MLLSLPCFLLFRTLFILFTLISQRSPFFNTHQLRICELKLIFIRIELYAWDFRLFELIDLTLIQLFISIILSLFSLLFSFIFWEIQLIKLRFLIHIKLLHLSTEHFWHFIEWRHVIFFLRFNFWFLFILLNNFLLKIWNDTLFGFLLRIAFFHFKERYFMFTLEVWCLNLWELSNCELHRFSRVKWNQSEHN